MKTHEEKTKGYVIVANRSLFFYKSAINLIESIKDNDVNANVTLVTESYLVDSSSRFADNVIFCGDHKRAKLWGMLKSPYDLTLYIDADVEVEHEDIILWKEEIKNNDLLFTSLAEDRSYCFVELYFPGGQFKLCGGICAYDQTNPLVKNFLLDWYLYTVKQYAGTWWPLNDRGEEDFINYPESLKRWDQFSLWWLTEKEEKYKNLKIKIFEDDARWNWYNNYKYKHNKNPVIIRHYSNSDAKRNLSFL